MQELGKINSMQLYRLWRNLSVGMLTVIVNIMLSKLLPYYLSPVVALLCAAFLYTYIYDNRAKHDTSCQVVPFAMLYSLVTYAFVTIVINILYAWGYLRIAPEFVFFTDPFIPSLILGPVCFVVFLYMSVRRRHLRLCQECKMRGTGGYAGTHFGGILAREVHMQLVNLTLLFGILTAVVWAYYLVFYINININDRDWYIFAWIIVILFFIDELYFIGRFYNLYLDLKEHDEIITPEEIQDMTAKTFLRFYVVCGNSLYVDPKVIDPKTPYKEVIDTPFVTKRAVNGLGIDEVRKIIHKMTGKDGELRFFFGRKSTEAKNQSFLRYFYFLDGKPEENNDLNTDGEWMDYEKIKYMYSNNPGRLGEMMVSDTTRLATIILTEKIFDDAGYRKSKIKFYNPSFNLIDVRKSNLDFQDDKWIRISMFNSDTPFYGLKRRWRYIVKGSRQ